MYSGIHICMCSGASIPANTKYLYNICTMLDQRRRRVPTLYKCYTNVLCLLGCQPHGSGSAFSGNMRHSAGAGLLLAQRRIRWANINPALNLCPMVICLEFHVILTCKNEPSTRRWVYDVGPTLTHHRFNVHHILNPLSASDADYTRHLTYFGVKLFQ